MFILIFHVKTTAVKKGAFVVVFATFANNVSDQKHGSMTPTGMCYLAHLKILSPSIHIKLVITEVRTDACMTA